MGVHSVEQRLTPGAEVLVSCVCMFIGLHHPHPFFTVAETRPHHHLPAAAWEALITPSLIPLRPLEWKVSAAATVAKALFSPPPSKTYNHHHRPRQLL